MQLETIIKVILKVIDVVQRLSSLWRRFYSRITFWRKKNMSDETSRSSAYTTKSTESASGNLRVNENRNWINLVSNYSDLIKQLLDDVSLKTDGQEGTEDK